MSALCLARVSGDVPQCNAPSTPASGRAWPLCERHLLMRDDVDRRWGHKPTSRAFVPSPAGIAEIVTKAPSKQSSADEELFAAMKRAMANGFKRHEPAYDDVEQLEEVA